MRTDLSLPAPVLGGRRQGQLPLADGFGVVPLPGQGDTHSRHVWIAILTGTALTPSARRDLRQDLWHGHRDDSSPMTPTDIYLTRGLALLHRRRGRVGYATLTAHIPGRLSGAAMTDCAIHIPVGVRRPRPWERQDMENIHFLGLLDRLQRLPNVRAADATLTGYRRKDLDDAALAYAAC